MSISHIQAAVLQSETSMKTSRLTSIISNLNVVCLLTVISTVLAAQGTPSITFNTNFQGGSIGKIEKLGDASFRCYVAGQHDERGRNRQANWYFFRLDNVLGRDVALTLTDFVGEYNDKPGACPMYAELRPVFSYDGESWKHFETMEWDDAKKEATLKFRPERNSIWIAHVPPYTHSRLLRLLDDLNRLPCARVEVIGKTAQGRDLHLVTVTNFEKPDAGKKTVWLQARQHAWETGTSYVMEGALRFATSEDRIARELRDKVVLKFTPMLDPDGCASGKVRFNANGYDLNRHWDVVDLRRKELLLLMPEIWYVKKAILGYLDSGRRIELMVNMHNTEITEYLDTMADDDAIHKRLRRFTDTLAATTSFDPSRPLSIATVPANTANCLWKERQIPVLLMEQRIGPSAKLRRRPTVEDRLQFGRELIKVMAGTTMDVAP